MTQCNCKNTDELRIVRGNAFAIRLTVSAIHIDGTPVENFVLGSSEAVLKAMHLDEKTPKDFLIIGNDAIISFGGDLSLGWYGFEMTGTFNGKPWRWCVPQVFQVVEINAKANIPAWAVMTDETYAINGVMTITSGDIYQSDWNETDPQSPSYIKNKPDVVLHSEFNETVQRIDRDIDDEETRAKGAERDLETAIGNEETRAKGAEQTLQEHIDAEALARGNADTTLQGNIDAEETRAKAAEKQNADDIDAIEEKIPTQASAQNQLADKQFVNSSISTATATYRGAYNLVSDLSLTVSATEQQIAAALATKMTALGITPDNNDYCFVQVPTSDATPTEIARVDRYKFNGTAWSFEFSLNNSGFTSAQWAALNSGITSGLVTKLGDLPTNSELTILLNGKQDTISDLQTIREGAAAGATAYQKPGGGIPKSDLDSSVQTSLGKADTAIQDVTQIENDIDNIEKLIPQQATEQNQLADKDYVDDGIATASATYRGAYNLVSDLSLTVSATEQQIAAALATKMTALGITPDNNDYCFVQVPTADATPTEIARVDRYKFNGTAWSFEFSLNNSGFTSAQWAALNSGITSGLVTKLGDLPTNSELTTLLNGKEDNSNKVTSLSAESTDTQYPSAKCVYDLHKANADDIDDIEALIPAQATPQNQLADKQYVDDGIATASATYRGAYNLVSDLELTTAATEQQIAAALATVMAAATPPIVPDNNDYCFVQVPTADATPTQIARVDRYKYNGTAWAFEFSLNNSGFTAAQWAALNSGITSGLVTKLSDLPTNSELTTMLNGKEDNSNKVTSLSAESTDTQYPSAKCVYDLHKQNADDIADIEVLIPAQATPQNQLADKDYVDNGLEDKQEQIDYLKSLREGGIDYIYIDENIADPFTRVYGDVNGPVIQWIRKNSHRFLGKRTADGVMTVCQLSDANSNLYAEDGSTAVLTGAEGDAWMWMPTFWTEATEVASKLWRIGFSKDSKGTGWKKWENDNLLAVFKAVTAPDKDGHAGGSDDGYGILRSISGGTIQRSVSQANFKTKARNKGTGYSLILWEQHCIMAVLYYAMYGNTDCQATLGNGKNTATTGVHDADGMKDSTNLAGQNDVPNFWGIEGFWGGFYELVENVEVNPMHTVTDSETGTETEEPMLGIWRITKADGTTRDVQGPTVPEGETSIQPYPQHLVLGGNLDIIPRGAQEAGSSSTYYCDRVYINNDGSRVVRRSYFNSGAGGGVAFANANNDASNTNTGYGSRLAFRGQIVTAKSVAAFKAAPDYVGEIEEANNGE